MHFILHGFACIRSCYGYPVALGRAKQCCRSISLKSLSRPQEFRKTSYFYNIFATVKTKNAIRLSLFSEDSFTNFYDHAQNYPNISYQASKYRGNPYSHSKRCGGSLRVWSVILLFKLRIVCWMVSTNATKLR